MSPCGVIVGCDRTLECLLPWWWNHYIAHNDFPVAFADFGMSDTALSWCKERGECVSLPRAESHEPPSEKKALWEQLYGPDLWSVRAAWFTKPYALLHSPFEIGLWIDIDCRVNGSLEPLFHSMHLGAEIGIVKEPNTNKQLNEQVGLLLPHEIEYNSGVIAFRQHAPILRQWAQEALENNALYPGDQQALSRAIFLHQPFLIEFPPHYNWLYTNDPHREALITHFYGPQGKCTILKQAYPDHLELIDRLMRPS